MPAEVEIMLDIFYLGVAVLFLAACVPLPASKTTPKAAPTQGQAAMANPASTYCVDKGGKVEIRDEAGGQVGYCVFPDGSECEEWAFYRGQCSPGSK